MSYMLSFLSRTKRLRECSKTGDRAWPPALRRPSVQEGRSSSNSSQQQCGLAPGGGGGGRCGGGRAGARGRRAARAAGARAGPPRGAGRAARAPVRLASTSVRRSSDASVRARKRGAQWVALLQVRSATVCCFDLRVHAGCSRVLKISAGGSWPQTVGRRRRSLQSARLPASLTHLANAHWTKHGRHSTTVMEFP